MTSLMQNKVSLDEIFIPLGIAFDLNYGVLITILKSQILSQVLCQLTSLNT